MPLLKKKRPYRRRRRQQETLMDQLSWSLDPDTAREVTGVILLLLGIIFILGIFGLAGSFGSAAMRINHYFFGILGLIVPFIFVILGVRMVIPRKEAELHASVTFGIIAAFIFIPALFGESGGIIGLTAGNIFRNFLGQLGGFIALLALSVVSILIGTNLSISKLWEQVNADSEDDDVKINHGNRVPVFRTLNGQRGAEGDTNARPVSKLKLADTNWELPPFDLLEENSTEPNPGDVKKNATLIEKTLKDFGIVVKVSDVNVGPTVTQYAMKPEEGVKLNGITARANDLALALAAKSLRVEAPIPGQAAVGVELPNKVQATVTLREVLESKDFQKVGSNLTLALGLGVAGDSRAVDLKQMPHLLIAGSTGSGKSVAINAILLTLLYQNSPADMRLLLVDPKRVEFTEYNGIPHLLTPVITEVDKTVSALKWAVSEMERRFQLLASLSRRNIEAYNQNPGEEGKMPYIVVVIDELADLMAQAANEVEGSIVRLAQMARAVGIHLVVATQRPSVNVITGLIKANISTRIAFQTASQIDSRTIIDIAGSEKLLGKGDMLYLSAELGKPIRIQGVNVTDKEISAVAEFLKKEGEAEYDEAIVNFKSHKSGGGDGSGSGSDDPMYEEAKALVLQSGKASASFLQRRLKLGYARAARLLDYMEDEGVVGASEGSKPRDILIDDVSSDKYNYKDGYELPEDRR